MLFTAPLWLSILVPIFFAPVLLVVSLAVRNWRRGSFDKSLILAAAALVLAFLTGGALFAAILVGFVLVTHWIGLAIEQAVARPDSGQRHRSRSAGIWLAIAVTSQVLMVAVISRGGVLVGPLQKVGATLVPFGLSYFALHGISYVVDVYRRRAVAARRRSHLAVHLLLLPQIVGGPVAYGGVAPQLARGWPSVSDYSYGVRRLLIGAWKVFVMADLISRQADAAFARRPADLSAFQAWVGLVSFTLQMYYAFSGYGDLGIGLGRMFGLRLPDNFRWPYVAQTVGEFWRRWHIGLSAWFREYADVAADDDRVHPTAVWHEALVVLLCGIWYGAAWTFVVWGAYHAALIILERMGMEARVKQLPEPIRHVYLLVVVIAGWVVLRSATLDGALKYFAALAGLNAAPWRGAPPVAIDQWLVLIAGAVGCAPLFPAIRRWTVAIDALIVSLLMMLFGTVLFAWRCGAMVVTPVLRWWRWSLMRVGARGGTTP